MLRVKGLECLVSILKCMVEWSRDHYIDPATTGLNTVRVMEGDLKEVAPGQSVANEVVDGSLAGGGGQEGEERGVAAAGVRHGMGPGKHGMGTGGGGGEGEVGARVEEFETRKKRKEKMQQGIQL